MKSKLDRITRSKQISQLWLLLAFRDGGKQLSNPSPFSRSVFFLLFPSVLHSLPPSFTSHLCIGPGVCVWGGGTDNGLFWPKTTLACNLALALTHFQYGYAHGHAAFHRTMCEFVGAREQWGHRLPCSWDLGLLHLLQPSSTAEQSSWQTQTCLSQFAFLWATFLLSSLHPVVLECTAANLDASVRH